MVVNTNTIKHINTDEMKEVLVEKRAITGAFISKKDLYESHINQLDQTDLFSDAVRFRCSNCNSYHTQSESTELRCAKTQMSIRDPTNITQGFRLDTPPIVIANSDDTTIILTESATYLSLNDYDSETTTVYSFAADESYYRAGFNIKPLHEFFKN